MRRSILGSVMLSLVMVSTGWCEPSRELGAQRFEFAQIHMGTEFRVIFYSSRPEVATKGAEEVFRRIGRLDETLSDYRDDSELTLLSQASGGEPRVVGDDLWKVLVRSQEIARLSHGAFDITVGPAVRLWRRARRTRQIPSADRIEQTLARVGYDKLVLHEARKEAAGAVPGMILDLGGIAKGFAVEEGLAVLRKQGVTSAMVVGGGEVALGDPPPGEEGWKVALNRPGETEGVQPEYLILSRAFVSTSGDASQFVEVEGVRYSHVIDPRTGRALTHRRQVTVVAHDGMTADASASALGVLPPGNEREDFVRRTKIAARIDELTEAGWSSWTSEGWARIPKRPVESKNIP